MSALDAFEGAVGSLAPVDAFGAGQVVGMIRIGLQHMPGRACAFDFDAELAPTVRAACEVLLDPGVKWSIDRARDGRASFKGERP